MKVNKKYIVSGMVLVLVAVAVIFAGRYGANKPSATASFSSEARVKGAPQAGVQIIEYSDFQCPACAAAQPTLNELLSRYPRDVQLVFRHFPLDGHRWSPFIHQASECAGEQGRFWEYHDILFAGQTEWSVLPEPLPRMLEYARDLGLDLEAFSACLTDEEIRERVMAQKQEGLGRQIRSTPTFFINGTMIVGNTELRQQGDELIQKALEK